VSQKVVYVAGPIGGSPVVNSWEREKNIRAAEEISLELLRDGYAVICPHTTCRFMDGVLPRETFIKADLSLLGRCDLMVLTDDWLRSEGACGEVVFAVDHGIPVFTLTEWRQHRGVERHLQAAREAARENAKQSG
jgi:nucleoside 2-deoxyribosyltransferase